MVYDQRLAERVRRALGGQEGLSEKKMFGGLGFLVQGNMCVGIWRESLVARLGPDAAALALKQPHVRPFDVTGKPLRGWVLVAPEGLVDFADLQGWLDQALHFVSTLPAK